MKTKSILFSFLVLLIAAASCSSYSEPIVVLFTTDIHGSLDSNILRASYYIKEQQKLHNTSTVVLDGGDFLQGSSVVNYYNFEKTDVTHPMVEYFNKMHYDAVTVGNHDIEAGKDVYDRMVKTAEMPFLAANVVDAATGKPYFKPYKIVYKQRYKIAIIGFLTPFVETWVPEVLRPGLVFQSIESQAQAWVDRVREDEHPDILIICTHSGWKGGLKEGASVENSTEWMARNVKGIDLICYGHDHQKSSGFFLNPDLDTVWVMNPGARLKNIARAEFYKRKSDFGLRLSMIPVKEIPVLKEGVPYLEKTEEEMEEYENKPIVEFTTYISTAEEFSKPIAWVDEIHLGQLAMGGIGSDYIPDISIAAPLVINDSIPAGVLTRSDFFRWFPFENLLCVVHLTGAEVKNLLEYAVSHNGNCQSFDTAAGIRYRWHLRRNYGDKIEILQMANGDPFEPDKMYNVVMNSYRAQGGGGHMTKGVGLTNEEIKERIVWYSSVNTRRMFMSWESRRAVVTPAVLNSWTSDRN